MPSNLSFPDSAYLMAIEQNKLPALTLNDPIFKLFPIQNRDAAHVIWEQEDDFRGLMQARGLNGPATGIAMVGTFRYSMDPGRYSEYVLLNESALEARRKPGSYDTLLNVNDLAFRAQDRLLDRRLTRIRWILWTLLSAGIFSVPGPTGVVLHKDQFAFQTQTASVAWATYATAKPISDLRAVKLKARGKSVVFNKTAMAFMNQSTMNDLLANANANDVFGKRIENGATINSQSDLDGITLANDLPTCVVMDDGYFTDAGVFTPYIPNNKVIIVGQRISGSQIGEFQMTRNVMNEGMGPGPYTIISDSNDAKGNVIVPRQVRCDDGFNGGPAVFFGGSVVVMTV